MHSYEFMVMEENGLHVRAVATLIAKLQKVIQDKGKLKRVLFECRNQKLPVTQFMNIVSMKIKRGETVKVYCEDPLSSSDQMELSLVFKHVQDDGVQQVADRLLIESSLTMEVVLEHLPSGVIMVNKDNVITYVNKIAIGLINLPEEALINQKADKVIPHSRLGTILKTGKTELAKRLELEHRVIIANRAPIIFEREIIGAIALFQDISHIEALSRELSEVKALQEELHLVLQSVDDLIGLSDASGKFIFLNPALIHFIEREKLENTVQSVIGQDLWKTIAKQHQPKAKIITFNEQSTFIGRINPTIIDGKFCGTVLTLSPFDDMRLLLEQLDMEKERSRYLEKELSKHQRFDPAFDQLIGESSTFNDTLSIANKVAKSDATVLITGESGTGKELVAKAIHDASMRVGKPFIRVNCAAIPPHLIESELFGHEKGAFTGAIQTRKGKFELAHKGTIFLDEIGDLNIDLQSKILRVLQERELERVGGYDTIKLDVRVIAATHQNLEKMIGDGTFREDLYYRLNVVPVHLPPLRKRRSDIPLLVDYFRMQLNERLGKSIKKYEKGFIKMLIQYGWPGNIRELRNIMERLVTLAEADVLYIKDLPNYIVCPSESIISRTSDNPIIQEDAPIRTMDDYEREIYTHVVQQFPSFNQMAKVLGVTHKTVAAKVRKYNLETLVGKKYQEVENKYPISR
jgi:TyrR family helix-turn-helix protein